mmetsp:Transcript_35600/g.64541  ORF Transcript_35600/g.64541 Transcript_35600/m.64541 type:complete len:222 (-) Transcript_35600:805-1470(-)
MRQFPPIFSNPQLCLCPVHLLDCFCLLPCSIDFARLCFEQLRPSVVSSLLKLFLFFASPPRNFLLRVSFSLCLSHLLNHHPISLLSLPKFLDGFVMGLCCPHVRSPLLCRKLLLIQPMFQRLNFCLLCMVQLRRGQGKPFLSCFELLVLGSCSPCSFLLSILFVSPASAWLLSLRSSCSLESFLLTILLLEEHFCGLAQSSFSLSLLVVFYEELLLHLHLS